MLKSGYAPLDIPAPISASPAGGDGSGKWYFCGPAVAARQGWKLYVSANRDDFLETLAAVTPVFERHRISFKYVASDKVLRKQNAGLYGYAQVGKVIVAYLEDERKAGRLVDDLKQALHGLRDKAPEVPFAEKVGGGWPLYYRYGAYAGKTIIIDGIELEDDRNRDASQIFASLEDPFRDVLEDQARLEEFDRLLLRYPVYEVLGQGGKGGVFAAFDIEADHFAELILKIGYRNGQVLPDGRDGMDLVAHEHGFFRLLEQRGLEGVAPAISNFVEFPTRNVLVMARIDGTNLLRMRVEGSLQVSHLESCLALMARIHGGGLYVGDAKLANFVADAEGKVWAIDFESAGEIASRRFDLLRTFHFSRPRIDDAAQLDRMHFLLSVLYKGEEGSFSESDRVIDLIAYLDGFRAESEVQEWAMARLATELQTLAAEPAAPPG